MKARSSDERVAPNDACLPSDARHAPFTHRTSLISRSGPLYFTSTPSICERSRLDAPFLSRVKTQLAVELSRNHYSLLSLAAATWLTHEAAAFCYPISPSRNNCNSASKTLLAYPLLASSALNRIFTFIEYIASLIGQLASSFVFVMLTLPIFEHMARDFQRSAISSVH